MLGQLTHHGQIELPHHPQTDEDHEGTSDRSSTDSSRLSDPATGQRQRLVAASQETSTPAIRSSGGSLTLLNGLAIVIGIQIGVGIFSVPCYVSAHVPSPGAGVLVWFLSGLLVWTGAASFVELGAAIPRNGGMQEYLRECYGEFAGFMFSWTWISVGRPCSMSIIALIFAEHVNGLILPHGWAGGWLNKVTAMMGIWVMTVVNCLGTYTGAHVATGFLVLKISTICSIIGAGVVAGVRGSGEGVGKSPLGWFGTEAFPPARPDGGEASVWALLGEYVTALFAALWVYGGWETIGFVAGELRNPIRDISRVINGAMSIVVSGFALMNIAVYVVLPMEVIRAKDTVVVTFGNTVFGPAGGLLYTLIVSLSALGSLNSNIFLTGRVVVSASRRKYFPKFLGVDTDIDVRENEDRYIRQKMRICPALVGHVCVWVSTTTRALRWEKQVPVYAMLLNATLASCYVLVGTFSAFLTFNGIVQYLIFFFAVLGVFRLRARMESQSTSSEKRYQTWSFNPVVFCLFSGALIIRGVVTEPGQGVAVCVCVGCGWLVYKYKVQPLLT